MAGFQRDGFTTINDAADHTITPTVTTLPTATAVYGPSSKLADIPLNDGVPQAVWSWNETDDVKNQMLTVGNTTPFTATYMAADSYFGTKDFEITPTIIARNLNDAGVSITLPAASYAYTGTGIEPVVTVSDTGAGITAGDYAVTYTNNTAPGTATVTISGQNNYQGTVNKTFTIYVSGVGTPSMNGITVNPGSLTFDPTGQLVVDISGLPAGAIVYYSLDGNTFSTTPPAFTSAGEYRLYLKITCPGYQDYRTETTVAVAKQEAPVIPGVSVPFIGGQGSGSMDLGNLLPALRGITLFQLGFVDDPDGILNGPPAIDQNGLITYRLVKNP